MALCVAKQEDAGPSSWLVPQWEMWGGKLCCFLRRKAKNTNWWPVTFGVAHQLSVLGRGAMLKGESGHFQVIHNGSLMVEHEQQILIPFF